MVQRVLRLGKHSLSSPWVGTTDGKGYVVASYSFRSQPVGAMPEALERRVSCAYPIVTRGPDPCFARSRNKVIIAKAIQPPVNKKTTTQHRGIEISLQPTGSRSPNIEIAVAPRLENQEDNGKNARKEQRHG